MAEKKGSLLGKIVILLVLVVVIGWPAHIVHFGKFKTNDSGEPMLGESKWPWSFSGDDWKVYWGETKAQAENIREQASEKWSELKAAAKENWDKLSDKIAHKTDNTEKLFVNRAAVVKELEALEATLPDDETTRNPEQTSIGWGCTAFKNALKEWEATLLWNKEQAVAGSKRTMDQLGKAVSNFTEAASSTAASSTAAKAKAEAAKAAVATAGPREQDPLLKAQKAAEDAAKVADERHKAVQELLKWAEEYLADFQARTEAISGS